MEDFLVTALLEGGQAMLKQKPARLEACAWPESEHVNLPMRETKRACVEEDLQPPQYNTVLYCTVFRAR